MRGKQRDGKRTVRPLPKRRKNVQMDPISGSIGALLREQRLEKQISQTKIAERLAKVSGGAPYNGRVSQIELGKSLPTDKELAVFASLFQLSVPTLRAKRDASTKRPWPKKGKGKTIIVNAPKPATRLAAKTARAAGQDAAGAPAVADWIEMVDGIVRMPLDPDSRKRWFAATMELFTLRGQQ